MNLLRKLLLVVLYLYLFVPSTIKADANQASRAVVTSRDDMPKHSYPIATSISELFASNEAIESLAESVQRDIQSDLASYDIQDAKTLRDKLNGLLNIALIGHHDSIALSILPQIRDLEDKPSAKALSGILSRCAIEATRVGKDGNYLCDDSVFASSLSSAISSLDWPMVLNDVKQMRGRLEMTSEDLFLGLAKTQYGPFVEKNHELPDAAAMGLLQIKAFVDRILPFKNTIIVTLGRIISENEMKKQDIWAEREVDVSLRKDLKRVRIGIWDTGVDPDAYPDHMYVNKAETPDGRDDDGNGFVDDVHGIAFTYAGDPESHILLPLADTEKSYILGFENDLKGGMDTRAGIDSKESRDLKRKISSMKPDEVGPFMEGFQHYVNYIHGTHIAGIAIDGIPSAEIVVSRLSLPYKIPPDLLTIENARRYAELYQKSVNYFKSRDVRVVCISWDMTEDFFPRILEVHGVGATQEECEQLGREMFDIMMDGMKLAMASAPEILFVVAAGNFDNDIDFQKMLPASIDLSNVMTVGAVDMAGDEASFTSYGKGVDVYADGYMIESRIPGKKTVTLSGTSQAAPGVANLAAKLLAVNPQLATDDVKYLILSGAKAKEGGRALLINPKESFRLLQLKMSH